MSLDASFAAERRLAPAPPHAAPREEEGSEGEEWEENAVRWSFELRGGEALFVPSGAPHSVDNLQHSVAISANYIDTSNLHRALGELQVGGVEDHRQQQVHAGLLELLERSPLRRDAREGDWTRQWLDEREGEEEPMFVPWDAFKRAEGLRWAKRQRQRDDTGLELDQEQKKRARCEEEEDVTREKINV